MVTFVLPTINRESLKRTLFSIIKQSDPNWKCIVIFDGIPINKIIDDKRLTYLSTEKKLGEIGTPHSKAGDVRNTVLPLVDTEVTAFVDDDDTLQTNYVSLINNDFDVDFVLYQMLLLGGRIVPGIGYRKITENLTGISFAIRTDFIKKNNLKFQSCQTEDYIFLKNAIDKGAKYRISDNVVYNVGF